jgi:RNA-directed DNA polymerase
MRLTDIFTFKNLYLAHKKARLGKRHKKDVILFEMDLLANLSTLQKELQDGTYRIGAYHHFTIYEPKKREIQALSYRDRVVQHCLVDSFLMPLLEKHLIQDNCACRLDKGTDYARKRIKEFLVASFRENGRQGFALCYDIHHYFDSIDHEVLKDRLRRLIKEEEILSFCGVVIDSYSFENDKKTGLPMGNQSSQCFALLYLDGIDRLFKERLGFKRYCRYMDDGIAFDGNKDKLRVSYKALKDGLVPLRLSLNGKTKILALKKGFEWLNCRYSYFPGGGIKTKLDSRLRKKIRRGFNGRNASFYRDYFRRFKEWRFLRFLWRKALASL